MPSVFTISGTALGEDIASKPVRQRKRKLPPLEVGKCRRISSGRRGTCTIEQCYFGKDDTLARQELMRDVLGHVVPTKTGYVLKKGSMDCSGSPKHKRGMAPKKK